MALSVHERLICCGEAAVATRLVGAAGTADQAIFATPNTRISRIPSDICRINADE